MKNISIALDWTANTNHTGFYVADRLGFFKNRGLSISIITPDIDNYAITSAKKLETGQVDFALCPLESIISYRTKATPFEAIAVAALLTQDISKIVCLDRDDIKTPKDLSGKTYASYKARYEDQMVKEMIANDGGEPTLTIVYPEKPGIWNTLLTGKADATWIFDNWEGVEARQKGIALNGFFMDDYNVPYGYSPVLATSKQLLHEKNTGYKHFIEATKEGFVFAANNPVEAVKILQPHVPRQSNELAFLIQSQLYTNNFMGNETDWGMMDDKVVKKFVDWIYERHLETIPVNWHSLFTNQLL